MISGTTREKWRRKLHTILIASRDDQIVLNRWEKEFLTSIHDSFTIGKRDLTMRQSMALGKIYDKVD